MPVHALLGATGSTGGAVLQCLLDEPQQGLELRVFVRNKSKLLKSFPDLEKTASTKITIIEGNLDDTTAMSKCLKGASLIYNCIASNDSAKGASVAQDAAKAVLTALRSLKQSEGGSYAKPTLLINRSQTLNPEHEKNGGFGRAMVHFALFYCYDDIAKAVEMFQKDSELCDLICVDPPALHAGPKRTGHEVKLTGDTFRSLNYPDLGAAFVEIAQRKQEFIGKGVIVGATQTSGKVEEHWDVLMGYMGRGVRARLLGI